jgi:HK97 family phage major capsid protein
MADDPTPVDALMSAFDEFKKTNDANLKQRDALLDDKLVKINATLDRYEDLNQKLVAGDAARKALQDQLDQVEAAVNRKNFGKGGAAPTKEEAEYRAAFSRSIRKPPEDRLPEDVALLNKRKAALIKADDTAAGYLLAPEEMIRDIIKDVTEMSSVRPYVTVRTIGGSGLKQPKRTQTAAATRVGEQTARVNTGDPKYGVFEISAPEMFARAEISQQMLEDSDYDLEAELRSEFVEQFALKEGQEFVAGTGVNNQAEGFMTNSSVGFVKSGNASLITADGLIDLFHEPKTIYTRNAVFMMNRSTLGAIRKLKDGQGQYLWAPGIPGAVPNTLLGTTYVEVPDMPSISANTYPVAFGDFRRAYIIVDRIAIQMQVDYTTGADDGLVVFRARKRVGGGVRQPEAIKKLKIAA